MTGPWFYKKGEKYDVSMPKVWSAADSDQGKFSGINQPTAGARFEQKLPVGKEPFQLYSLGTPNGVKVTIMLEEPTGRGYY